MMTESIIAKGFAAFPPLTLVGSPVLCRAPKKILMDWGCAVALQPLWKRHAATLEGAPTNAWRLSSASPA
jgi:hypothetical protein